MATVTLVRPNIRSDTTPWHRLYSSYPWGRWAGGYLETRMSTGCGLGFVDYAWGERTETLLASTADIKLRFVKGLCEECFPDG